MCNFKSGIIFKDRIVLAPDTCESHSVLLEKLEIEDDIFNASKMFVRAELFPPYGSDITADITKWHYIVDQDILPEWYILEPAEYEKAFRDKVEQHIKDNYEFICGYAWNKIKEDGLGTYYLMYGTFINSKFGQSNNYNDSHIKMILSERELLSQLKSKYGDKLVPISTDLVSADGFKTYGKSEGDYLSILSMSMMMECGERIPSIEDNYWLATPSQTADRGCNDLLQCVLPEGHILSSSCYMYYGIRPFFILKD